MALVDTFGARARRQLLGSVPVAIGVVILGALIIVCALARWLAPYNPTRAVGGINEPPSLAHLFGTTGQGQDVLSQFLYGGQNTLWVAFAIAVLTTLIALVVALTSAYFRGWSMTR